MDTHVTITHPQSVLNLISDKICYTRRPRRMREYRIMDLCGYMEFSINMDILAQIVDKGISEISNNTPCNESSIISIQFCDNYFLVIEGFEHRIGCKHHYKNNTLDSTSNGDECNCKDSEDYALLKEVIFNMERKCICE